MDQIDLLNEKYSGLNPEEVLLYFLDKYQGRIAFASSMSIEDQALTHMIAKIDKNARIFTLDTGRLFPETIDLIERTNLFLGIKIEVYFPDYNLIEKMIRSKGINLFYKSVADRKECCRIRKIEPLLRALNGTDIWICGLRKDQSITRINSKMVEWDKTNRLFKLNPLINWDEQQVREYIAEYKIPYNRMHDKGYPSIGCQPCTRSVQPGEDARAGRWWWEDPEHKECGLHRK